MDDVALYALGALDAEETRMFEQRLANDETLRAELRSYEPVLAELSLAVPEVAPPPHLRAQLLAHIAAPAPKSQPAVALSAEFSLRADAVPWQRMSDKVFCKLLFTDPQSGMVTTLVKLEPGGYLPRHRHLGVEQSLVIEGDCRVNGEVFYPGDFRVRASATEDSMVTTDHGTTILLIAPAQFENLDAHWPN